MFSLPQSILYQILDYALPFIPAIRPEFQTIPIERFFNNPKAFFYLRYHKLPLCILSPCMLSQQTHDDIVSYLIAHPEYIDANIFCKNLNPKAVQFILDRFTSYDFHWVYLSQNTNDDMVCYLLKHPRMINWHEFSSNPNEQVVTYLLSHQHHIVWYSFSRNKNKRVISYLLDHPEHITWHYFCKHHDDRIVQYLLQHPDVLQRVVYDLPSNTHDDIVLYLINHNLVKASSFFENTNPHAIQYILDHSVKFHPCLHAHPDVRIFLMMIRDNSKYISSYCSHPHVFYETINSEEYELYQDLLLGKSVEK